MTSTSHVGMAKKALTESHKEGWMSSTTAWFIRDKTKGNCWNFIALGNAMLISLLRYNDTMSSGITCCNDSMKGVA